MNGNIVWNVIWATRSVVEKVNNKGIVIEFFVSCDTSEQYLEQTHMNNVYYASMCTLYATGIYKSPFLMIWAFATRLQEYMGGLFFFSWKTNDSKFS